MATGLESAQGRKKWCVMVYFAADVDLESAALADLEQMKAAGSSSHVDLLAQLNPGGSRLVTRYHLQKDTYLREDRVPQIDENGAEVILHNVDAKQDLLDFIEWGMNQSQAEHYALVLWGHARGWKADAVDPCSLAGAVEVPEILEKAVADVTGDAFPITPASLPITLVNGKTGFLSNRDLSEVLARASFTLGRKIDILGLDACMMAMAEICYQVHQSVDYLVACEDTVPDESWPYDSILKLLVTHAEQMKPEDFARTIVWKFVHDFGRKKKYVTQSIFRLGSDNHASLNNLTDAMKDLVDALTSEMNDPEVRWAIMIARTHVQSFYMREYVDLYDFCRLLSINCNNRWVLNACQDVMEAIAGSPSTNGDGPASKLIVDFGIYGYPLKRSHGISVYFPCVDEIPKCYPELEFCKRTNWDKFLHAFLSSPKGTLAREEPADAVAKPSQVPAAAREVEPAAAGLNAAFAKEPLAAVSQQVLQGESGETIVAAHVPHNGNGIKTTHNDTIKTTHNDTIKTTYGDVIKTTHGDPIKVPIIPEWMLPSRTKFNSPTTITSPVEGGKESTPDATRRCNCDGH